MSGGPGREIAIDFAADDGGTGPLTWGQQAIWKPIRWYGEADPYFNVHRVVTLPGGVDEPALADVLRSLVEAQQSLRNRFARVDGTLVQSVQRRGAIRLPVYERGDRPAAEVAAEVLDRMLPTRFAIGARWPYALAAVSSGGTVDRLVVVASHLCLDGWAVESFARRVVAGLGGAVGVPAGEPWGTLAQADFESSPRGRRRSETAVAAWVDKLAAVPDPPRRRPPRPAADARWHRADLDSRAVAAAVTVIAARTRASTSAVLLAATCSLLAALEGGDTWAIQLIAANRYEPRRRQVLDAATQNAMLVAAPAATDWDGLVREVYRLATTAYSRAQYDTAELDRAVAPLAARPGVAAALTSYFNDTRTHHDSWDDLAGVEVSAADLERMRESSVLAPSGTFPRQDCRFFMHVHATARRCQLRLLADTAFLAPAEILRALRAVETVLVVAAGRPGMPLAELPALLDLDGPAP